MNKIQKILAESKFNVTLQVQRVKQKKNSKYEHLFK